MTATDLPAPQVAAPPVTMTMRLTLTRQDGSVFSDEAVGTMEYDPSEPAAPQMAATLRAMAAEFDEIHREDTGSEGAASGGCCGGGCS